MSIIRLIHIKIDPSEAENAVRIWKTECASLMIQQAGCVSEMLLRCRDAPEFISYSEWESEAAIEAYRNSDAHKEIVRHTRGLKGAKAEVKLYELVKQSGSEAAWLCFASATTIQACSRGGGAAAVWSSCRSPHILPRGRDISSDGS